MNTYTFKTDTLRDVNGADYVMAHMEDASGAYLTRGAVTWQLVNAIMLQTSAYSVPIQIKFLGMQICPSHPLSNTQN